MEFPQLFPSGAIAPGPFLQPETLSSITEMMTQELNPNRLSSKAKGYFPQELKLCRLKLASRAQAPYTKIRLKSSSSTNQYQPQELKLQAEILDSRAQAPQTSISLKSSSSIEQNQFQELKLHRLKLVTRAQAPQTSISLESLSSRL